MSIQASIGLAFSGAELNSASGPWALTRAISKAVTHIFPTPPGSPAPGATGVNILSHISMQTGNDLDLFQCWVSGVEYEMTSLHSLIIVNPNTTGVVSVYKSITDGWDPPWGSTGALALKGKSAMVYACEGEPAWPITYPTRNLTFGASGGGPFTVELILIGTGVIA